MFLLLCPKCKNKMKYQTRTMTLENKVKRCVYCGHSFNAEKHILKKLT